MVFHSPVESHPADPAGVVISQPLPDSAARPGLDGHLQLGLLSSLPCLCDCLGLVDVGRLGLEHSLSHGWNLCGRGRPQVLYVVSISLHTWPDI